jgi:hypothetical protein
MSGVSKTNLGENGSDMLFPQAHSFRMALKSMQDGEDLFAVKSNVESHFVPIDVSIVEPNEGGDFGVGEWAKGSCASPP